MSETSGMQLSYDIYAKQIRNRPNYDPQKDESMLNRIAEDYGATYSISHTNAEEVIIVNGLAPEVF